MKKILTYLLIGAVSLGVVSCKKLDINENPNRPTEGTPTLVLPQAIVATAALSQSYNSTYYYNGGFFANVYGFGAYGNTVSLGYTSLDFNNLWINSYDNLTDYQYVIDNTGADANLAYSNAVARIMKSFVFSKIVDNWGDVPYSEALKGQLALTPKYDKGVDIYKSLVGELTSAIALINTAQPLTSTTPIVASSDPMFGGNMNRWKRFANTLKLRLLVKMAAVPEATSFATTEFAAFDNTLGVLEDDALVNPGYLKQAGRLAPIYLSLAANESDARSATSSLPSTWIYSFYNGAKLSDPGRGSVVFRNFPNTQRNQLGNENLASTVIPPAGSTAWYTGADFSTPGLGAVKGPSQGQVIMLLAEANLVKAEAIVRGFIPGDAAATFDAGVSGSFKYLFKSQTGVVDASKDVAASLAAYKAANPTSYLVNFNLATSTAQRVEAIITQKYIAMNPINCDEAFAEFRRTAYPAIVNGSSVPTATFASTQSTSTSPDRLLVRLPYASSEYQRNPNNTPQNVNIFTAKIFWDLN
jgi:hypothetical protein